MCVCSITLNIFRDFFTIEMAERYIKANPGKDFLLRRSNQPVRSSLAMDGFVWTMSEFSLYEAQVAKAMMRVMVRKHYVHGM